MVEQVTRIPEGDLRSFTEAVLTKTGMALEDAKTVSDCLVSADLRGIGSHGVSRLPIYVKRLQSGIVDPIARPEIQSRQGAGILVDGKNACGPIVGAFAIEQAVNLAKTSGLGMALVRRSNHYGIASYYALRAVAADAVGIACTNATPTMAAHGAKTAILGTNPLAAAVPAGRYGKFVLDISSSVVARGKIITAARKKAPIPLGWALDMKGQLTTDAQQALEGVVLPFAGHKGSGLSLLIDILCGVLSGAAFGTDIHDQYLNFEKPQDVGHFFLVVDIASWIEPAQFVARMEEMIGKLKVQPRAEGFEEILFPGELEDRLENKNRKSGVLIDKSTVEQLDALAKEVGVDWLFLL